MLKVSKLEDTPWQEKPMKPSMFFEDQISRMMVKAVHIQLISPLVFSFSLHKILNYKCVAQSMWTLWGKWYPGTNICTEKIVLFLLYYYSWHITLHLFLPFHPLTFFFKELHQYFILCFSIWCLPTPKKNRKRRAIKLLHWMPAISSFYMISIQVNVS